MNVSSNPKTRVAAFLARRRNPSSRVWLCAIAAVVSNVYGDLVERQTVLEAFTTSNGPIIELTSGSGGNTLGDYAVTVYEIDGIRVVEQVLSRDLPVDQSQSQRLAIGRLQRMDGSDRLQMRSAAMGLAKAMQYGIERTPAVVFNSDVVVYGVTDLATAIEAYEAWQTERKKR